MFVYDAATITLLVGTLPIVCDGTQQSVKNNFQQLQDDARCDGEKMEAVVPPTAKLPLTLRFTFFDIAFHCAAALQILRCVPTEARPCEAHGPASDHVGWIVHAQIHTADPNQKG